MLKIIVKEHVKMFIGFILARDISVSEFRIHVPQLPMKFYSECVKHIFITFLLVQFASASRLYMLGSSSPENIVHLLGKWMSRLEEH